MLTKDHHTLTVTTDMATLGGYNYVKESVLAMADHKEGINNIDFGMLVIRKDVVGDDAPFFALGRCLVPCSFGSS